jgi:uncharacterized protein
MKKLILCVLLAIATLAVALAQELPAPQGYLSDYAEMLSPQMREQLTALLRELEAKTTVEVALLTVKTTQPLDEFQYAVKIFDAWKIGKRGQDNGALFLVASEDRRVRILTGYGLEGILPDGKVGAILDEFVLPHFREGRYDEGIYKGVWAMALVIAQEARVELTGEAPVEIRQISNDGIALPFIIFILVAIIIFSSLMRTARRSARGAFPWWILTTAAAGSSGKRGSFGSGGFSRGSFGGFGGGRTGGGGAGRAW